MIYAIYAFVLLVGMLIGLLVGYWRLSTWYEAHTGNNLWREVEKTNRKQKLDSSKEDEVVERMARVGFNTIFEDEWDELDPISSEHALWLQIASNMLTELRRLEAQLKLVAYHTLETARKVEVL